MKVIVNSTPVSLWRDIVHEAESNCATTLPHELEAYVVFLLVRYADKPEIANEIMATRFLDSLTTKHEAQLLGVGDTCLLFSGFFPGLAEKRLVKISYFINLGRSAYVAVSKTSNDLYSLLAQQFVAIMDILQSIRQLARSYPELKPLQAYELWNESGSKRALHVLRQYSQAQPMHTQTDNGPCIIKLK